MEYTGPKDLTQYFIRFSSISALKFLWLGNYERRSCTQSQNFIRNTSMALGAKSEVEVTVVFPVRLACVEPKAWLADLVVCMQPCITKFYIRVKAEQANVLIWETKMK